MRRHHLLAFFAGLLVPIVPALLAQSAAPFERNRRLSSEELASCVNRGGHVAIAGLAGNQTCVLPLPDAGKACTSSSQCVGQCLLDESRLNGRTIRPNARAVGRCQPTNYGFGCRTNVENGRIAMSLCVD